MVDSGVLDRVLAEVRRHCEGKGHREGPGVNNFVPHDCVAALAAARRLVASGDFDRYVAVSPEGHIYAYFLERLGVEVLSVYADYPPTRCDSEDDLSGLAGMRVLVVEDDVMGGGTLRLVAAHLARSAPASLSLYLGHTQGIQRLHNVPPAFGAVYVAEDLLDWSTREAHERAFEAFFTAGGDAEMAGTKA